MFAYHVDRGNNLSPNITIDLLEPHIEASVNTDTILDSFKTLYNKRLSIFGERYAINCYEPINHTLEQMLELIRISDYPNKVSRFQAFFAYLNIEDAIRFSKGECAIYKIEFNHDNYHEGDINFLKGNSVLQSYTFIHNYWKGIKTSKPEIELLIEPPLKILNQVKYL